MQIVNEDLESISYSKLVAHINSVHPREHGQIFGCCADMGCFPCCYWATKSVGKRPSDDLSQPLEDINVVDI